VALIVVDASVVIGFLDATDAHHRAAVAAIADAASHVLVLPATAYAEVLVAPARRGPSVLATVEEALAALTMRVEPVTPAIAREAAILRARTRSLRLPDALVLATGKILDATRILTADRAWLGISRRVHLI
jgi:predicted nucleic acid-binding protein